jgi:excisionase family DNA binding protein
VTDEERAELKAIVAEALAEALAAREPRKKSRAAGVGLLTLEEASELVRAPVSTIRFWIWQGKLTAYKPGRTVLVKQAELVALVEAGETVKKRAARRRSNSVAERENESEG